MKRANHGYLSPIMVVLAVSLAIAIYEEREYLQAIGRVLLMSLMIVIIVATFVGCVLLLHILYLRLCRVDIKDIGQHGSLSIKNGKILTHNALTLHPLPRPQTLISEVVESKEPETLKPVHVPTMKELLSNQYIQGMNTGVSMLLGYETIDNKLNPIIEQFDSYRTLGISGVSRSGKTNTEVFLTCQAVMLNMHITVCDTNYSKPTSLTNAIEPLERVGLVNIARQLGEIEDACTTFFTELHRRINGEISQGDYIPSVLLIDEYTSIGMNKQLMKRIQPGLLELTTQGSGYGMYLIVGAQSFKASVAGGNVLVDSLQSAIVHRTTQQESNLLLPFSYGKNAPLLKTGECIVKTSNADFYDLSIPLVTKEDCNNIANSMNKSTIMGLFSYQWSNTTTDKLIPDLLPNPYRS